MASFYLKQIAQVFPSSEMVSNIVKGKASKMLGINEYVSLITLAFLVNYLNTFGILDKIIEYINCQANTILTDWMLLGVYVISITITIFFICSLSLQPLKIIIDRLNKFFSHFTSQKEPLSFNKLKKQIDGTYSTKTWTTSLIEYSIKQHSILWLAIPVTIILDILRITTLLTCQLVISIIWYLIYIARSIGRIFSKTGRWVLSLSDRNVIAYSFRIAIILAFGCTVIINQYKPFLINHETTSVFEFISSAIIIPIILEWILSYKTSLNNTKDGTTKAK